MSTDQANEIPIKVQVTSPKPKPAAAPKPGTVRSPGSTRRTLIGAGVLGTGTVLVSAAGTYGVTGLVVAGGAVAATGVGAVVVRRRLKSGARRRTTAGRVTAKTSGATGARRVAGVGRRKATTSAGTPKVSGWSAGRRPRPGAATTAARAGRATGAARPVSPVRTAAGKALDKVTPAKAKARKATSTSGAHSTGGKSSTGGKGTGRNSFTSTASGTGKPGKPNRGKGTTAVHGGASTAPDRTHPEKRGKDTGADWDDLDYYGPDRHRDDDEFTPDMGEHADDEEAVFAAEGTGTGLVERGTHNAIKGFTGFAHRVGDHVRAGHRGPWVRALTEPFDGLGTAINGAVKARKDKTTEPAPAAAEKTSEPTAYTTPATDTTSTEPHWKGDTTAPTTTPVSATSTKGPTGMFGFEDTANSVKSWAPSVPEDTTAMLQHLPNGLHEMAAAFTAMGNTLMSEYPYAEVTGATLVGIGKTLSMCAGQAEPLHGDFRNANEDDLRRREEPRPGEAHWNV